MQNAFSILLSRNAEVVAVAAGLEGHEDGDEFWDEEIHPRQHV